MIAHNVRVFQGDIDDEWMQLVHDAGSVAWDIETTGLDLYAAHIATCQLAAAGRIAVVQVDPRGNPSRLSALLQNRVVRKVFHHAPFDLRFMTHHWQIEAANVACTKIAAKVVDPRRDRATYSLRPLLERYLDIVIDKSEQRSDWARANLSSEQIAYAATDVKHLQLLLDTLLRRAEEQGLLGLVQSSFAYLPARVQLDLLGAADVYAY